MKDAEKAREIGSYRDLGAMRKPVRRAGLDFSLLLEEVDVSIPCDAAEGQNSSRLKDREFAFEVGATIQDFGRQGLVFGWRATDSRGDVAIPELEAVPAADRGGLVRETGLVESLVEKIARAVAGENSSGAVASVSGGGEAQDEQLRAGIAESGDAASPIVPVAVGAALFAGNPLAVGDKTRALAAGGDFVRNDLQCGAGVHCLPLRISARMTA